MRTPAPASSAPARPLLTDDLMSGEGEFTLVDARGRAVATLDLSNLPNNPAPIRRPRD